MTAICFRLFVTILWDIWVLHVKRQILTWYFVTSFLYSLKFVLLRRIEYPKGCLWTKMGVYEQTIEMFLWLSFCDMTIPSKSNVPSLWHWPLTYEGQFFYWIEYSPISIMYTFQIDISSYSREITYQNIGRTTHTDRQTQTGRQTAWKQYLTTRSGGEVIINNPT